MNKGRRHEARIWVVQFLFQRDFNRGDLDEDLALFWEGKTDKDQALHDFAEDMIRGVEAGRDALDRQLEVYAEHWKVQRMGAADRNILRLALYEMLHCPDIPPVVSINEAVELAKAFSGHESGRFVNGILDRAVKDLDRPTRTAVPRGGYHGRMG